MQQKVFLGNFKKYQKQTSLSSELTQNIIFEIQTKSKANGFSFLKSKLNPKQVTLVFEI